MEIIRIAITAFSSIVVLFLLTKIMGDRQMSQLSMFDYINGITIGSISAELAVSRDGEYMAPLVAMIIYAFVSIGISLVTCKSIFLRRFFEGHALIIYHNGRLYEKNLFKAKIDVDEFLSMCRVKGYFDLEEIYMVILEPNGKLSIIPLAQNQPVTNKDLNLTPVQSTPLANVIIDGHIMKDNLKSTGNNEKWVEKQLSSQGYPDIKEIMLATYDGNKNKLNFYAKIHEKMTRDIFE